MTEENEKSNIDVLQPVSLRNLLVVLFKRKRIILTFFITVVCVVTVGSLLTPDIYQAESKLWLEKEFDSEKALLFKMSLPEGYAKYDFIDSEIEILNSYPIASRVVKNFQSSLVAKDDKQLSQKEEIQRFERVVKKLQKNIEIENPKNTNILIIRYENENPKLASDINNYFAKTYTEYRSEISSETDTYKFFEEQMKLADEKLSKLEQRQAQFKEEKDVGTPETKRTILLTRLTEYERSLTAVQTKRIGKEAKLDVIEEQLQNNISVNIPSTETSDSPSRVGHISKLKGELLDMEIKKEQLLQKYTPQYKEVKDLEKQIAVTRSKIMNEVRQIVQMEEAAIRALLAEERVLQSRINKTKKEVRDLAQKEFEYNQISRGIDDEREIYSMLLKQGEEARISLAKLERGVKIKVISPAVEPTEKVKPKLVMNIILSIFLGMFGGLGMAFFLEYFDHSINTPEEMERFAGISSLGSVREIEINEKEAAESIHAVRVLE